jgi:LacI family transcriptional regulator
VPDILNPFFVTLIKSISNEARIFGYALLLCDSNENSDFEKKSILNMLEKRADGLILAPVGINSDHFQEIQKSNIPCSPCR